MDSTPAPCHCGQTRRSVSGFSLTVPEESVVFVILIFSVHLTRVEQCIFSQINIPVYHLSVSNLCVLVVVKSHISRHLPSVFEFACTGWAQRGAASATTLEAGPAIAHGCIS